MNLSFPRSESLISFVTADTSAVRLLRETQQPACVCVCVCVCAHARRREAKKEGARLLVAIVKPFLPLLLEGPGASELRIIDFPYALEPQIAKPLVSHGFEAERPQGLDIEPAQGHEPENP